MNRGRVVWLALLSGLVVACEKQVTEPPPPPEPGPPPGVVQAVYPPARSTGIVYDTPVWVQFAVALDTASVNERTVFFKDETRRIASTLTWDPATRRLHIAPHEGLRLRQTYTVELTGALRFVDETTLGRDYFWQFSTTSLRRIESPTPMDDQIHESPFTTLQWGGLTEGSAGPVTYQLRASTDSIAVATGTVPPVATLEGPPFLPRVRWAQDRPTYWSIEAVNAATGDHLTGPVWRFTPFPVDAPYDSTPAVVVDWDWVQQGEILRQRCTEDSLTMGVSIMTTVRWALGPPDTTVKLARVAIEMTPRYAAHEAVVGPSVWTTTEDWVHCVQYPDGPPFTDEVNGKLADAVVASPTRIRFESDALTAHVEATRRIGGFHGYIFRSPLRRTYFGPGAGSPIVRATMWLYVYRTPPAPPAVATAARSHEPLAGRRSGR